MRSSGLAQTSLVIVDEDLGFASNARRVLKDLGLDVSLTDPDDIECIRRDTPKLVIINAELPSSGASGFSLCNRLRREETLSDLRIMMTSDGSSTEALNRHTQTPERADLYIEKPITDEQLCRDVVALLAANDQEDEDSVAFISDEEVLEIRAAPTSVPPPLPELMLEPWQAMRFEEMIQERCSQNAPAPPTQPNQEIRMDYLRDRVRYLEQRDKAAREAWNIIQEQGREMERQAAVIKVSYERQQGDLSLTQMRLDEETQKFSAYNEKVSAVFENKDANESSLQAKVEQRSDEVKHLRSALEARKQAQEKLESALEQAQDEIEQNQAQIIELKEDLVTATETHRAEIEDRTLENNSRIDSLESNNGKALEDLKKAQESYLRKLNTEHETALLIAEANHTDLILEVNAEHEAVHERRQLIFDAQNRETQFIAHAMRQELVGL